MNFPGCSHYEEEDLMGSKIKKSSRKEGILLLDFFVANQID
jgi:hypothetical protein